mgnify:CR=1 FL=1
MIKIQAPIDKTSPASLKPLPNNSKNILNKILATLTVAVVAAVVTYLVSNIFLALIVAASVVALTVLAFWLYNQFKSNANSTIEINKVEEQVQANVKAAKNNERVSEVNDNNNNKVEEFSYDNLYLDDFFKLPEVKTEVKEEEPKKQEEVNDQQASEEVNTEAEEVKTEEVNTEAEEVEKEEVNANKLEAEAKVEEIPNTEVNKKADVKETIKFKGNSTHNNQEGVTKVRKSLDIILEEDGEDGEVNAKEEVKNQQADFKQQLINLIDKLPQNPALTSVKSSQKIKQNTTATKNDAYYSIMKDLIELVHSMDLLLNPNKVLSYLAKDKQNTQIKKLLVALGPSFKNTRDVESPLQTEFTEVRRLLTAKEKIKTNINHGEVYEAIKKINQEASRINNLPVIGDNAYNAELSKLLGILAIKKIYDNKNILPKDAINLSTYEIVSCIVKTLEDKTKLFLDNNKPEVPNNKLANNKKVAIKELPKKVDNTKPKSIIPQENVANKKTDVGNSYDGDLREEKSMILPNQGKNKLIK